MEQGRLDEAVAAYQQMADLKPDPQAYTRAAHMRWLKGDLEGALEVMQMAVQAASPRDPESAAWVNTRMALYQLQAGDFEKCRQHCKAALEFQKNYPPALLAEGRLLLAENNFADALDPLRLAEKLNPLPEYQWTLADALRAAGQIGEAADIENRIKTQGIAADPRTCALFLATRGDDVLTAVNLARAELQTRGDVITHDVLARSLAAAGCWNEAETEVQLALAEGTQDARLFLHAGIVAAKFSRTADAEKFLGQAANLQQMLLPSEREQLKNVSATLSHQQANSNQTKNQNTKERSHT